MTLPAMGPVAIPPPPREKWPKPVKIPPEMYVAPTNADGTPYALDDVVARMSEVVPHFVERPVRLRDARAIADALNIGIEEIDVSLSCTALWPPIFSGDWRMITISKHLHGPARIGAILHELAHAIADAPCGPRDLEAERRCDVVALIGLTTPGQRARGVERLKLFREIYSILDDPEWPAEVRAREVSEALRREPPVGATATSRRIVGGARSG